MGTTDPNFGNLYQSLLNKELLHSSLDSKQTVSTGLGRAWVWLKNLVGAAEAYKINNVAQNLLEYLNGNINKIQGADRKFAANVIDQVLSKGAQKLNPTQIATYIHFSSILSPVTVNPAYGVVGNGVGAKAVGETSTLSLPKEQPHANFRTLNLKLAGSNAKLAGMAHPVRYASGDFRTSLEKIRNAGYDTLISLDSGQAQEIKSTWEETLGCKRYEVAVRDFTAPTQQNFDDVYAIVCLASQSGKSVAIHCGEGWGRTGTVLASLQPRSFFDYLKTNVNPARAYLSSPMEKSTILDLGEHADKPQINTTPMVAKAVEAVRTKDVHGSHNRSTEGSSVENESQVDSLVKLELRLREELRNWLNRQ
jgi:hypothetical protein